MAGSSTDKDWDPLLSKNEDYPGKPFNHLLHEVNAIEMQYIGYFSKCQPPADKLWLAGSKHVESNLLQSQVEDDHLVWRDGQSVIKMQPIEFLRRGEKSTDRNFNEVIHEATIGSVLNRIKSKHFAQVKCYDFCHTCIPQLLSDVDRYHRCAYVMYHYVPGVTLEKYLTGCSAVKLRQILWQLFQALHQAYTKYEFTHYDLHLANVVINNQDPENPYPVIVDYGSSYISLPVEGDLIPIGRELGLGAIARRPCWQHDVFKICMWLYSLLNEELVIENTKNYLQQEIYRLRLEIHNAQELIYPAWHIRAMRARLSSDQTNSLQSLNIEQKLNKINQRNFHNRQLITENNHRLHQLEITLHHLADDPLIAIPERPYAFCPILESIISYFTAEKTTNIWFGDYRKEYKYMQLDDNMMNTYYDFDQFLQEAKCLLIEDYKN